MKRTFGHGRPQREDDVRTKTADGHLPAEGNRSPLQSPGKEPVLLKP